MTIRFLPLLLLPLIGISQTNAQVELPISGSTVSEKQPMEIKRNALYNLEEIKVRWKKAALENYTGVPCSAITAPGAPTGVVATVGNTSVSVSFVAPTNNGGRAITAYTVTSNPGNITAPGTTSPINVTGLTIGTAYTFTVIATNELGNSVASSASTVVTAFTCGTGTISDFDNNSYLKVLIGTQCWTQTNLKVTKFNDGTNIPEINSTGTWDNTIVTGARTVYNDLPANLSTYGYIYNWYAATDSRKICPTDWHVPTDTELTTLRDYLGGGSVTGALMKKNDALWTPNTGTNTSGFSALPGGFRKVDGSFLGILQSAQFWSATANGGNASMGGLESVHSSFNFGNLSKSFGGSVRCLKD